MNTSGKKTPSLDRVKQRAKKLKKENNISHTKALDLISQEYGFKDWVAYQNYTLKEEQASIRTPPPSLKFITGEDIILSNKDSELLDNERSEELDRETKKHINENKKVLTNWGIEFSIFEPTETGLKKSILDATQAVRTHFSLENFHHYLQQGQGPKNKVIKNAIFLDDDGVASSKMSLYRPNTKKGDPRMWFKYLNTYAVSGDQIAIVIKDDIAYLINLTRIKLLESISSNKSELKTFLETYKAKHSAVSDELLNKLKILAQSSFPSSRQGDTGIGFTLEEKLGIQANSSKKPDYKGIEIKSGRGGKNRTTLFAQVANWSISPCKKSAEILNKYGYERDNDFKLYCTLSTQKQNSQKLSFTYNQNKDQLEEWFDNKELVAIWPSELLRKRLKEKHNETFWINATSTRINGVEHFELISVTHTKSPIISQLMPLIESGVITMDHLIKRNGKTGRVSEKGPLFKMNKNDLNLLFPEPITYILKGS